MDAAATANVNWVTVNAMADSAGTTAVKVSQLRALERFRRTVSQLTVVKLCGNASLEEGSQRERNERSGTT